MGVLSPRVHLDLNMSIKYQHLHCFPVSAPTPVPSLSYSGHPHRGLPTPPHSLSLSPHPPLSQPGSVQTRRRPQPRAFARAQPAVWLQHHPAPTPRTAPLHALLEERNIPNPGGTDRSRGQHPPGTAVRGRSTSRRVSPPPRGAPVCRGALNGCGALSRRALPAGQRDTAIPTALFPCLPPAAARPPPPPTPLPPPVPYCSDSAERPRSNDSRLGRAQLLSPRLPPSPGALPGGAGGPTAPGPPRRGGSGGPGPAPRTCGVSLSPGPGFLSALLLRLPRAPHGPRSPARPGRSHPARPEAEGTCPALPGGR